MTILKCTDLYVILIIDEVLEMGYRADEKVSKLFFLY